MSSKSRLVCLIMLVVVVGMPGNAMSQNLREAARAQAVRNPGVALEQPAPPFDYEPKAVEELAKEAVVVVQARLSRSRSYLSQQEDRVLTDYRIVLPKVVAGNLRLETPRLPGAGQPLILTVWGGEVIVEGISIRGTDNNREPIQDGGDYLLFLRESRPRQSGHYEIFHGGIFEISQDQVRPLLKAADNVFKGGVDAGLKDIILRIQNAVRIRQPPRARTPTS